MINKKIATRDFAGGSFHRDNEGECEEPGASNSETGIYDERRELTIKHTSDFGDIGELYIAGWQQFEDAIISWTEKEFKRIVKDLQEEQKKYK